MYHNTLNHSGTQLREYEAKAMTQDDVIYEWFVHRGRISGRGHTPSEVVLLFENTPVTSVRRSMNTLTKQGKLIKTDEQRMGPYGRPETVWRLAEPQQGELL